MTETSGNDSPSFLENVDSRALIIDNLEQNSALTSDSLATRYNVVPLTSVTTAANTTPAQAIAMPAKAFATATTATVATEQPLHTNAAQSKATASASKADAPRSDMRANPAKEVRAKSTSSTATVTASKPNAAANATAQPTHSDSTLPGSGNFKKHTASTLKPMNNKRLQDSENGSSRHVSSDKPNKMPKAKYGPKTNSTNPRISTKGTISSSMTKVLTPKIATKKSLVTSDPTLATLEPPQPKRTKAFKSRRGPSFQAAEIATASKSNAVSMEFSTTCYYVQLGDVGQTYFVHEHHLSKSPRLLEEVKTAKSKSRKTQQQIIQLSPHNAGAFCQMLGYLYSDQFKALECNSGIKMIGQRMKEIHEVMGLAKYYSMPALQKDIMRVVSKDRWVLRVGVAAFFDWSEDMWHEEMDMKNGPFTKYFQRHAPSMLNFATEKDLKGMMRIIGEGGEYVNELFMAMHKANALRGASVIKSEPGTFDFSRASL